MNREALIEQFKERLPDYIQGELGYSLKKHFRCLSGSHADNKPSMIYDPKRYKVHCFSCSADYDLFDVIGIVEGTEDFNEQFSRANELYGSGERIESRSPGERDPQPEAPKVSRKEIKQTIAAAHEKAHLTDYFSKRGISEEAIKRYKLGYLADKQRVIIPIGKEYYISRDIAEKRYFKLSGYEAPLWNEHYLKDRAADEIIWIVEGIFDALSLEEANRNIKAIALNGTAHNRIIELIKEHKTQSLFVISMDNDKAGTDAAERIRAALDELQITNTIYKAGSGMKDANEMLLENREMFIHAINNANERLKNEMLQQRAEILEEQNMKIYHEYMNSSAAQFVREDFINGIKERISASEIPTGYSKLDDILDGGLYEGLYVIGAISSLGKTSYVIQLADQIAQQGHDVIYFSLEMSRAEIVAKSISRLTTEAENNYHHKTTRAILNGRRYKHYSEGERGAIQEAINQYASYAERIFIHEGIGDIGANKISETVENHIIITGRKPVIVIDYLQILAPYEVKATDKQNTDKAVLELKRLSRDKKIPVIAISSFNRQNYSEGVSMNAFKESGAIEYSSDVLIGLQLKGIETDEAEGEKKQKQVNTDALKRKDPREVELKVLKNRNGRLGDKITYKYYTAYNLFIEL